MFEGKVYYISGAASGIGSATALRLASKGVSGLALSDLDIQGLESTAQQYRVNLHKLPSTLFYDEKMRSGYIELRSIWRGDRDPRLGPRLEAVLGD